MATRRARQSRNCSNICDRALGNLFASRVIAAASTRVLRTYELEAESEQPSKGQTKLQGHYPKYTRTLKNVPVIYDLQQRAASDSHVSVQIFENTPVAISLISLHLQRQRQPC